MIYFTSDHHFYHQNIIEYCSRPFSNVEEMNAELIERYNFFVGKQDVVYFLGDVSFGKPKEFIEDIFPKLSGHKHLISGNHDKRNLKYWKKIFLSVQDYLEIEYESIKIVMSHYPFLSWNKGHRGSWMLHGHVHSSDNNLNLESIKNGFYRYDVGVDANKYFPVSIDEIKENFRCINDQKAI